MLEGIALESFKRRLSDEFLYALSVQEPGTLDAALRIAQRIERDMTNSTERKELLQLGPTGKQPTQPYNSAQARTPWTNNYRRGPNDNNYQQTSTSYRSKSPNDYRSNQYQASEFQEQQRRPSTYQPRSFQNNFPRGSETYQSRTRPNYTPRGPEYFQQRRPQSNLYQGGWQLLPHPQYPAGYMINITPLHIMGTCPRLHQHRTFRPKLTPEGRI